MTKTGTVTILKREAPDEKLSFTVRDDKYVQYACGEYSRSCIEILVLMKDSPIEVRGKFVRYHDSQYFDNYVVNDDVEPYCEAIVFHESLTDEFGNWQVFSKSTTDDEQYIKYLKDIMGFEDFDTSSDEYNLFKSMIESLLTKLLLVK